MMSHHDYSLRDHTFLWLVHGTVFLVGVLVSDDWSEAVVVCLVAHHLEPSVRQLNFVLTCKKTPSFLKLLTAWRNAEM